MADPIILEWVFPRLVETQWMLPPDRPGAVAAIISLPGPPGPAGGTAYEHLQPSPAAEWVVNHNLGLRPSVTVLSPGGVEVEAHVIHQSSQQLRIYFASPQSGSAHCI